MKIQGVRLQGTKLVPSGAAVVESDTYFNLVSLLLPGNGTNEAQNNTFVDSSTNAFTVTRNGNTTQGTFSPFSQTGWSNYFDGTGDYLATPSNAAFTFGTGDLTLECWIYQTVTSSGSYQVIFGDNVYGETGGYTLYSYNNALNLWRGGGEIIAPAGTITLNAWNHVAWTRSGSSNRLFINGNQVGATTADSTNYTSSILRIGANRLDTLPFFGYISNARALKGTALYTANFTVPTTPLTAIANTSLLTCQSNRFIDNSTNAFAITVGGNTAVQAFAPFDPVTAYAAGTVGGSAYFDGNGDYLTVADNTAFEFGSGDFTIEGWFYALSVASDTTIVSKWTATGTANSNSWLLFVTSGVATFLTSTNGSAVDVNISGGTVTVNSWNHIAVSRSGNTYSLYLNGTRTATTTNSNSLADVATVVAIGRYSGGTLGYMNGYISNARIVKGTAVYTGSTYTVPTAPVTAVTNTQLLLNYTNGGITDAAAKNVLETVGGAAISTAQSKWGGSSMAFDGSGDYLVSPASVNYEVGTGSYTIEFWVYWNVIGNIAMLFGWNGGATGSTFGYTYSDGRIGVGINGTNEIVSSSGQATTGSWIHMAFVKNGSTTTIYKNGVAIASSTTGVWSSNTGTATFSVGGGASASDTNCYIDDLRITKGYARYTADFTAPTTAFPVQ